MASTECRVIGEEKAEELRKQGFNVPRVTRTEKKVSEAERRLSSADRLEACKVIWVTREITLRKIQEATEKANAALAEGETKHTGAISVPWEEVLDIVRIDYRAYATPEQARVTRAYLSLAYKEGEVEILEDGSEYVHTQDGPFVKSVSTFCNPWTTKEFFENFVRAMKADDLESRGVVPRGTLQGVKKTITAENTREATDDELRTGKAATPAGPMGRAARTRLGEAWGDLAIAKGATEKHFATIRGEATGMKPWEKEE